MTHRPALSLIAAALSLAATSAPAQSVSDVALLPGWSEADGTRMAGVEITLAPGWKTYWRQPMGNGIPPQFDWSGSQNVAQVQLHWPSPEVFETYGMKSAGYEGQVVFPVEVTPADPGQPIRLDLSLFYGVCEEVCIPAEADVSLDLPSAANGASAPIRAALGTATLPASAAGITAHRCAVSPAGDSFALTTEIDSGARLPTPQMVVYETGSEEIWISPKRWTMADRSTTIEAGLAYYGTGAFAFDRSAVRITLLGNGRAIELRGCPS